MMGPEEQIVKTLIVLLYIPSGLVTNFLLISIGKEAYQQSASMCN